MLDSSAISHIQVIGFRVSYVRGASAVFIVIEVDYVTHFLPTTVHPPVMPVERQLLSTPGLHPG